MKKLLTLLVCFVLSIGICVHIQQSIDPTEARILEDRVWMDRYLQEKKRTPFQYLQMEYAQYVLHNVSFAEVPYSVSDYEWTFGPLSYDSPGIYRLAHCKSFSSNARLRNEAECRAYLEQLWHGMGQIGHTGAVPRKIVHYPACNTVGFGFGNYMLHYKNDGMVLDGGMTVYVDDRTGEFIGLGW